MKNLFLTVVWMGLGGFFINMNAQVSQQIDAVQYFYNTDPGIGVAGNGAIVPLTPSTDVDQVFSFPLPSSLEGGMHRLYIRFRDTEGRWSLAERRTFYISDVADGTKNIVAYQYYFDTDPGVGVAGTGAIVSISSTDDFDGTVALNVPASLENGIHNLYLRTKDELGRWSLAERRTFYISDVAGGTKNIVAYQYYFDTDPGVGVAGNGGIVSIPTTNDFDGTVTLNVPASLENGIHKLYLRTKDELGNWSLAEGRMFYISDVADGPKDIVSLEYFFDDDPGVGNGIPYPVHPATGDLNEIIDLSVPCLSAGDHYLYIRAQDAKGRWSIFEKDTVTVSGDIAPSSINPEGPINICANEDITLSATPLDGMNYQWLKDDVAIPGETAHYLVVDEAGDYALQTDCGGTPAISAAVTVQVQPLVTFYADADGDGYGDATITTMDCTPPAGYVYNATDCDDSDESIHPGASETCNGIDDDCDGSVDEGVKSTFYADTDNDGYGDPVSTQSACVAPPGYVADNTDCDDTDASVNPGATEVCNEIDDDCDGFIDEGVQTEYFADNDGDGFGDAGNSLFACSPPAGYITDNTDCDDNNAAVFPGAVESCNGVDDDCDGSTDEGFEYSEPPIGIQSSIGTDFCLGESTTLSVDGGMLGTDADWYWYEGGCGSGSFIGNGSSIVISAPTSGIHQYYVRAEGICNMSSCASIVITVVEPPVFTDCPTDITVQNDPGLCSAMVHYTVHADGYPAVEYNFAFSGATSGSGSGTGDGETFAKGLTNVTVSTSNSCGSDECTFTVTVLDSEDPQVVSCPMDKTFESDDLVPDVSWDESDIQFEDNCTSDVTIEDDRPVAFPFGSTTVQYTATDESGNTAVCAFDVQVNYPDFLDDLNLYIFANDIEFSTIVPGGFVTVTATIHNGSDVDAPEFNVQFTDDELPLSLPPQPVEGGIKANNSKKVTAVFAVKPEPNLFVPIRLEIDPAGDLPETTTLDNMAIRPYSYEFTGGIDVTASATPSTAPAGSNFEICGSASYDADPYSGNPVSGAEVTIINVTTGQITYTYTNSAGDYCASIKSSNTPTGFDGAEHFEVHVTDQTLEGSTTGSYSLTDGAPCALDYELRLELQSSDFLGCSTSELHVVEGTTVDAEVYFLNYCNTHGVPTDIYLERMPPPNPPESWIIEPDITQELSSYVINNIVDASDVPGSYQVWARVPFDDTYESDGSNNLSKVYDIIVLENKPDVAPVSAELTTSLLCKDPAVRVEIDNRGGDNALPFEVMLEIFDSDDQAVVPPITTTTSGAIDPVCTQILDIPIDPLPSPGTYRFEISCNTGGSPIDEISTSNNDLKFVSTLEECKKDLFVWNCGQLKVLPSTTGNEFVVAEATIQNIGEEIITEDFPVRFSYGSNGAYSLQTVTEDLDPGETVVVQSNDILLSEHFGSLLIVEVDLEDASNSVVESDELGNNVASGSICYDFELTNLDEAGETITPLEQHSCDPIKLSVGIYNNGLLEADHLNINYEILGPGLTDPLSGSIETPLATTCSSPRIFSLENSVSWPGYGNYQIVITADTVDADLPEGTYPECGSEDNELIFNVEVKNAPDYAVYSQYIAPSKLNPDLNEPVSFNLTYINEGCVGVNPMDLMIEIDGSVHELIEDVESPDPGQFITKAVSASWSSDIRGWHIMREFIDFSETDMSGFIDETDETNNMASRALFVGYASDVSPGVSVADAHPSPGESTYITATINNEDGDLGGALKRAGNRSSGLTDLPYSTGTLQFFYQSANKLPVLINEQTIKIDKGQTIVRTIPWTVKDPFATIIVKVIDVDPVDINLANNEDRFQLNNLGINVSTTDVICAGLSTGSIDLNVSGGNPPYSVEWSNGMNGMHIEVASGNYTATVTDINGLEKVVQASITDLDTPQTYFEDNDGDGFGNVSSSTLDCIQPAGYVSDNTDCDDNDANIHPDAGETCNGLDDDCDGLVDDNDPSVSGQQTWYLDLDEDGYGDPNTSISRCDSPPGYVSDHTDCNDLDSLINPGSQEVCNDIDDDCDGLIDDNDPSIIGLSTWYVDNDGDGYGNADTSLQACDPPAGYVGTGTDCDDTTAVTYPGAEEILDGLDNDCDGQVDEGLSNMSVDAGDCEKVFLGYGPEECVDLSVVVTDGIPPYMFAWNTGDSSQTLNVCPEETQSYTVEVTDATGYNVSDEVTVQVIDVRCGGNNNKVSICHYPPGNSGNTQNLCISVNAVETHLLEHGDYLGACGAVDPCGGGTPSQLAKSDNVDAFNQTKPEPSNIDWDHSRLGQELLEVFPNPTHASVTIRCTHPLDQIEILSMTGEKIKQWEVGSKQIVIDLSGMRSGMYLVKATDVVHRTHMKRLVIVK